MRITAFLLIICAVCGYAENTHSQNARVSINKSNIQLSEILTEIESQTDYLFIYNTQVNVNKKTTVRVKEKPVSEVLDRLFDNTNITYAMEGSHIILSKKENEASIYASISETKSQQQSNTITGTVVDSNGEPVIGANVIQKGTTNGTITNFDGEFSLNVPAGSTIEITYIGYLKQEVHVGNQKNIKIVLVEDSQSLDEVVVVGYAVQKKVNLSGAVQAVSGETITNRPITNVNRGLQGLVPNLNIANKSGRADDAPEINIRGFTSINGGEAFILVDNVPVTSEELARLNPDDIASVSVLKDASSAAIYGARAAFGVVLVTTKKASSNELKISFNGNVAIRDRGMRPEIITDLVEMMEMKNLARTPLSPVFSEAQLDYARKIQADPSLPRIIPNPNNPNAWDYYGETDWIDEGYRKTAPAYTANVNISKKDEILSYYVSGGFYQEDGLLRYGNDKLRRFNFRGNAEMKLTNWWKLGTNISYVNSTYDSPTFLDGYFNWNINRTASNNIPRNPDGTWSSAGAAVLGASGEGGRRDDRKNEVQVSLNTQFDIIKNVWTVNADANFRRYNFNRDQYNLSVPYRTGPGQPIQNSLSDRGSTTYAEFRAEEKKYDVYNLYTNFVKTFNEKHFFNAMIGYNRELTNNRLYTTRKDVLISGQLPEINLATGQASATNERSELALEGYFGRLNYIYDNRYIIEFNGRYDGSSRFPDGDRYGFFPSVSAAWVLGNEQFFHNIAETLKISNLKLRGSYGSLGNQVIIEDEKQIYYPYIPYMKSERIEYILDGDRPTAVYQPGVVSPTLTWEQVRTINGGIDLGLFNGKFDLAFDYYVRYTEDMLTYSKELPLVFGASAPRTNAADLKTKGWELTVGYRDQFTLANSPFNWSVKMMLADSRTWITKYDNPAKLIPDDDKTFYEGQRIGEIWGFINDGFFQSEAELAALDQTAVGTDDQNYKFYVGDTKFKDLNGDDKIDFGDRTVDNPGDRKIIGNSEIRLPYSFELAADWKGFDIRAFFQGVGKRDWYPSAASIYFWGVYAQPWTNPTIKNRDHWTPEKPDGYFPRMKAYIAEDKNEELGAPQTKYLQDASYLRLKNLTLGYTLPKSVLEQLRVEYLRIYFSAENLLTFSNLDKDVDLDPEIVNKSYSGFDSGTYPMQRTYSFGVNLTF